MSELTDRLAALVSPGPSGSDMKALNTPESWKPRLEVDPDGGYLISTPRPAGEMPDAEQLLHEFDLDPMMWSVTSLRKSRWQNHAGEWLEAYRASLAPVQPENTELDFDLEQLIHEVSKWRPSKGQKKQTGELAYLFVPSDQQIGKKQEMMELSPPSPVCFL